MKNFTCLFVILRSQSLLGTKFALFIFGGVFYLSSTHSMAVYAVRLNRLTCTRDLHFILCLSPKWDLLMPSADNLFGGTYKRHKAESAKVNAVILPFVCSLITSCKPIIIVSVTILACVGKFSLVSLSVMLAHCSSSKSNFACLALLKGICLS